MSLRLAPLQTARLRLEPMAIEVARAILAGDLSGLTVAEGWPHGRKRGRLPPGFAGQLKQVRSASGKIWLPGLLAQP